MPSVRCIGMLFAVLGLVAAPLAAQVVAEIAQEEKFLYVQNDGLEVIRVYQHNRLLGRVHSKWGECFRLTGPAGQQRITIVAGGSLHSFPQSTVRQLEILFTPTHQAYHIRVQTLRDFERQGLVPAEVCMQKRPTPD